MWKEPLKGELYLHKGSVYKVIRVSSGTNEVVLEDIKDGVLYTTSFSTFRFGYERVFRIGELAKLVGRNTRSLYRYESSGLIRKPMTYSHKGVRDVRFYTKDDILEVHELISGVHQGRPRSDRKIVNNTLVDEATLRIRLRERYGI